MGANDVEQGIFHVARHAGGVAAHIDVRAFLQPLPDIGTGFLQLVLHIDLVLALSGPGQIGPGQQAALAVLQPFGLIQEVVGEALVPENQPVLSGGTRRTPLLHEGTERSHAGACADHDDGGVVVGRQAEIPVGFDEDAHVVIFFQQMAQIAGGCTHVVLAMVAQVHHAHGQMHGIAHLVLGRGNGVQTRRLRAEQAEELLRRQRMGVLGKEAHRGRGGQ